MIKNSIKTELKRYLKVTSYETSKKYIRPDMTSQIRKQKTADSEVDRYLQESCKSYKECEIKNNARRNSLQKRTLGIETERKMANANLSREEKQLREQLKQMQIEKAKNDIMHNMRELKDKKITSHINHTKTSHAIPTEPYPVTFLTNTPSSFDVEKSGRAYANSRRRRQSKEYEDLSLEDTGSRLLLSIDEDSELVGGHRRRVYSMSSAQRPTYKTHLGIGSNSSSPRTSPGLRRKISSAKRGQTGNNSNGSSRESLNTGSVTSLDELHWVGDPEAIHSVRRARKTVEDQELESELYKLTHSKAKKS